MITIMNPIILQMTVHYFILLYVYKIIVRTSERSSKKKYNENINIVECHNDRVAYENWMDILIKKKIE